MPIAPIVEIIAEIKAGRMVILVDEEDRENEGDLVLAADHVTPQAVNFMARFGRGLVCMAITEARARQLDLAPMTRVNRSVHGTNFTVSIEAASGVSTGISAHDRAHTIRVAAAANATPDDIVQPGHVFPLIAQPIHWNDPNERTPTRPVVSPFARQWVKRCSFDCVPSISHPQSV